MIKVCIGQGGQVEGSGAWRALALIGALALGCGGEGAAKVEGSGADSGGATDEGAADGGADGADGATDGADGSTDGADGATDGGATDGGTDGTTDGGADGTTDGGADGATDGGTDAADGGEEPPPPALPVEGAWSLADWSLTRDDCGVASFQDPAAFLAEAYAISHVDPVTFALSADGGAPGDCAVTDGVSFSCASATLRQDLGSFGFDAEMVIDTQLSGTLSEDRRSLVGATDITVVCDGDCWLIEFVLDFPCPMQIDMTLTAD
jgi:hypothetical protein